MSEGNEKYTEHLRGIVQIPSVSTVNDEATDWKQFEALHEYLAKCYPLVHQKAELIPVGKASLLFHLKSKEAKKLPVLLMAHQDVVPAIHPEQWTYPPFSAAVADGCIWGRGSEDCKSLLIEELEAMEELLEENFEPDFDIYLSFGHNEEVQCADDKKGSVLAARYLKEQGIKIGCIFDEGGNVDEGAVPVANVALAEKAPNEFVIYQDGAGGHASKPGRGTVLGVVSKAAAIIEAHPMPYRLTPLTKAYLKASAPFAGKDREKIYRHPKKHWKSLCRLAKKDRELDALLHTTFALTMAQAASQANVLPSHAEMTMSVRILQGDTVESVREYLESILPKDIRVKVTFGEDPKPEGRTDSREFKQLAGIIREVFGNETAVIPSIMLGATDSRNYYEVCDNIFRFSGRYKTKKWGEAHQVDERMPIEGLEMAVRFFKTFLKKY